ncbi:MAG: hypothetical protein Q8S14_03545 [Algoriphagus sp.]|uniref:hypothetical protein n=1 Tax=Algoriphagus sp. TaxID=1872435 RepID=UPI00272F7C67|nr:hypothetical protein [Algoriphagus sp.]MDP2040002.1 hypothetical protein [Algoriphagus sp.]MDP3470925.1 hypothetical protein [Algoriphagus sp.]
MKIVSIFERSKECLYAVMYDDNDHDVLEILQEKWSDPEDLRKFFKQYKRDYEAYYGQASLSQIVEKAIDDADALFETLFELAEDDKGKHLSEFFKPLHNKEAGKAYDLQQLKAYGILNNSFLRIYAIRFRNSYVITGGAIKLTDQMKDRKHTQEELHKLNLAKDYLKEKGEEGEFVYLDF